MTVSRHRALSMSLYLGPERRNQSQWPWPCRQLEACELWLWWELSVCVCGRERERKRGRERESSSGYYRVGAIITRQTLNGLPLPWWAILKGPMKSKSGGKKKSSVSNLCSTGKICVLIESSLILAWVEVTTNHRGATRGAPVARYS